MNGNEMCSTCRYAGLTDYADRGDDVYECRRYAPRPRLVPEVSFSISEAVRVAANVPKLHEANWPLVSSVDWCGEYVLQVLHNRDED